MSVAFVYVIRPALCLVTHSIHLCQHNNVVGPKYYEKTLFLSTYWASIIDSISISRQ